MINTKLKSLRLARVQSKIFIANANWTAPRSVEAIWFKSGHGHGGLVGELPGKGSDSSSAHKAKRRQKSLTWYLTMRHIRPHPLLPHALLSNYANVGAYTDCFTTDIHRIVTHAEFVEAFYTGRLFKLERWLLRVFLSRPSTDLQVRQLAAGELNEFAAWRVEARAVDQLLMCDIGGRTRSWLMVAPSDVPGHTRLYFGSAVVPAVNPVTGKSSLGFGFTALLGFHKLYSRALLGAAAARLARPRS